MILIIVCAMSIVSTFNIGNYKHLYNRHLIPQKLSGGTIDTVAGQHQGKQTQFAYHAPCLHTTQVECGLLTCLPYASRRSPRPGGILIGPARAEQ